MVTDKKIVVIVALFALMIVGIMPYVSAWTTDDCGTGGTVTIDGDYCVNTFTSDGNFTPLVAGNVEVLAVGGGGGTGTYTNSGGGAGGYVTNSSYAVTVTDYPIVIGQGGAGAVSGQAANGDSGTDTTFGTITANGGGYGGYGAWTNNIAGGLGATGGSAGGRGLSYGGGATGAGTAADGSGQGYAGGGTSYAAQSGGGGGAGGAGGDGKTVNPWCGDPGAGISNSINGTAVIYAQGGSCQTTTDLPNTGMGGNGGAGVAGKDGQDGVLILRYNATSTDSTAAVYDLTWETTGGFTDDTLSYGQTIDIINVTVNSSSAISGVYLTVTNPSDIEIVSNVSISNYSLTGYSYTNNIILSSVGTWNVNITAVTAGGANSTSSNITVSINTQSTKDGWYGYANKSYLTLAEIIDLSSYGYDIFEFEENVSEIQASFDDLLMSINDSRNTNIKSGINIILDFDYDNETLKTQYLNDIAENFSTLITVPYADSISYISLELYNITGGSGGGTNATNGTAVTDWWNSAWDYKKLITNLTGEYPTINLSKEVNGTSNFSDLRSLTVEKILN